MRRASLVVISAFGQTVDVGDLRAGVTRPGGPYTGFHERVLTSAFTLPPGEGMSYTGIPGRGGPGGSDPLTLTAGHLFHFFGRYQPYGVCVRPDGSVGDYGPVRGRRTGAVGRRLSECRGG